MADYPPYMNAYGNVTKILNKIKEARTPERFTQDYLETVLGFSGGSARPFISLAKRIGLLAGDGTPTDLYNRFRNPAQSEQAMADAIRFGYSELYRRNEFVHSMDKPKLEGLIMEITGLDSSAQTLKAIANTFEALKGFANFELTGTPEASPKDEVAKKDASPKGAAKQAAGSTGVAVDIPAGLRFSHNIYINLPDTTDVEVFNAIFKALKENLLS
jgi:hypothetical protein